MTTNSSDKARPGVEDLFHVNARGRVTARWTRTRACVPQDAGTPAEPGAYPALEVHNTISYSAADVLAEAYGGDTSRVPRYIGFVYGNDDESSSLGAVERDMTMPSLKAMVESVHGNIQISRFSRPPTVGNYAEYNEDSSEGDIPYRNNTVEFHAVTKSGVDGFYEDSSAGTFSAGDIIYRAVLLGDGPNPCGDEPYTLLAMVDLKTPSGNYRAKPDGYELALDWRVTFK